MLSMFKTLCYRVYKSNTLDTVIMPILQIRKPMLWRTYVSWYINPEGLSPEPVFLVPLLNKGSRICSVTTQQ